MSETETFSPIRLTYREEGTWVVCRMQPNIGSTGEIIELARVRLTVLHGCPEAWAHFKAMMTESMARTIQEILGSSSTFVEEPAPESEKSGHA